MVGRARRQVVAGVLVGGGVRCGGICCADVGFVVAGAVGVVGFDGVDMVLVARIFGVAAAGCARDGDAVFVPLVMDVVGQAVGVMHGRGEGVAATDADAARVVRRDGVDEGVAGVAGDALGVVGAVGVGNADADVFAGFVAERDVAVVDGTRDGFAIGQPLVVDEGFAVVVFFVMACAA